MKIFFNYEADLSMSNTGEHWNSADFSTFQVSLALAASTNEQASNEFEAGRENELSWKTRLEILYSGELSELVLNVQVGSISFRVDPVSDRDAEFSKTIFLGLHQALSPIWGAIRSLSGVQDALTDAARDVEALDAVYDSNESFLLTAPDAALVQQSLQLFGERLQRAFESWKAEYSSAQRTNFTTTRFKKSFQKSIAQLYANLQQATASSRRSPQQRIDEYIESVTQSLRTSPALQKAAEAQLDLRHEDILAFLALGRSAATTKKHQRL